MVQRTSLEVDKETGLIDYESVEKLAQENKLNLLSQAERIFKIVISKFKEICDKVGAYLLVDMAHFSGLVAEEHIQTQQSMQM